MKASSDALAIQVETSGIQTDTTGIDGVNEDTTDKVAVVACMWRRSKFLNDLGAAFAVQSRVQNLCGDEQVIEHQLV